MKLSLILLSLWFSVLSTAQSFKSYDLREIEESASVNGYSSSIWGVVQTHFVLNPGNGVDPKIGMPALFWKSRNSVFKKTPTPMPLVVIFPGTYGSESGGPSISLGRIFKNKNYHVLSLANPLSESYIKARIPVAPLDLPNQGLVFRGAIEKVILKIGPEQVSSIHFVGVSYGAFLAAVIASYGAKISGAPIQTLSLVSPPLHFGRAIQRLDQMLDRSQEVWDSQIERKLPFGDLWQLLTNKASSLIPEPFHYRAEAIFSHLGFRVQAATALELYDRAWNLNYLPKTQSEKRDWKNNLRIWNEIARFSPRGSHFLKHPQLSDLGYWLSKVKKLGKSNISLLSSIDDPLNEAADWKKNSHFNLLKDTYLLKRGGHCGFLNHPLFKSALYYRIH